jgi:L-iditol 2-dehydrogenase
LLAWPSERLYPVPDGLDPGVITALEPLGVAIHAMDLAHLRIDDTVAVAGCGPIGVMTVQLALLAGARHVVAVDPLAHRRELAASFGAVAVSPEQAASTVAELSAGLGVDVALEVSGTDAAVDLSIGMARPGARVVLVGIPDGDRTTFTASGARRKGLTLVMSRRMKEVYPRAIELTVSKRIDLDAVISDRIPLADAGTAFARAADRTGHKVVVTG